MPETHLAPQLPPPLFTLPSPPPPHSTPLHPPPHPQDKLHQNLCRQRSLVAIGTHDLSKCRGPFTYEALPPSEISFVPLKQTTKFRADQLMEVREGGRREEEFPRSGFWKGLRGLCTRTGVFLWVEGWLNMTRTETSAHRHICALYCLPPPHSTTCLTTRS